MSQFEPNRQESSGEPAANYKSTDEALNAVLKRLEAVEDELAEAEARAEAAEERAEKAEERAAAAEARVEELENRKYVSDEHELVHEGLTKWKDYTEDRLAELEDKVEATQQATRAGSAKAYASEDPSKMLPVEKLGELPNDVAKQQLDNEQNRNLYRARYIWENFDELSYTTGTADNRGEHLKSSDVKRALNTWDEEDAHVESKTVERVFRRLEEWSFWLCETRHKSGERRLWRPDDWEAQREAAREEAELKNHHLASDQSDAVVREA